jgi:hypothetical protein
MKEEVYPKAHKEKLSLITKHINAKSPRGRADAHSPGDLISY